MTDRNTPTGLLKEEHQHVLQKLATLEDILNRLRERDAVSGQLKELAAFFETDFWPHFTKEEEALFPELDKVIPRDAGPLRVMLMEHDELRRLNDGMQRTIAEYLAGSDSQQTIAMLQGQGNSFITTLREHIDKEDNILFMIIDEHLDSNQAGAVLEHFAQIETDGSTIKQ